MTDKSTDDTDENIDDARSHALYLLTTDIRVKLQKKYRDVLILLLKDLQSDLISNELLIKSNLLSTMINYTFDGLASDIMREKKEFVENMGIKLELTALKKCINNLIE